MRTTAWMILVLALSLGGGYYLFQGAAPDPGEDGAAVAAPASPRNNASTPPGRAPALSTNPAQSALQRFTELLTQGEYSAAAALYEAQENGDPTEFAALQEAYGAHLKSMMKAGDYQAVLALSEVFLGYYYNDFPSLDYRAAACSHSGDFRCAIDAYYAAILYSSDQKNARVAAGGLQQFLDKIDALWSEAQRWQELITLYEHAEQWQPDHAEYHLRLAEIYLQLGDFSMADTMLAAARRLAGSQRRIRAVEQAIAQQAAGESGIPMHKQGRHYLVDVRLNGMPLRLMIDTGASVSALSGDAARRVIDGAGLQYQGEIQLSTAGGTLESSVYRADTVAIGSHELFGTEWVLIDFHQPGVDGVLGMNILGQFEFQLDQQAQRLILQLR